MRVTIYQRLSKKRRDCPSFLKLLRKWQFLQSVRFELKFSVFGRGLLFFLWDVIFAGEMGILDKQPTKNCCELDFFVCKSIYFL